MHMMLNHVHIINQKAAFVNSFDSDFTFMTRNHALYILYIVHLYNF